ncbi:MAG TPA: sigma 54-interacting transcriptional regulator [Acidobacteriota bacterium]|nr:sigma 54-interacting transcriptional regulator [Acidobacteriota bacterium]
MITLVVDSGIRPISFPLSESFGEIVAGSIPENAIYLPFKGISRRHFSVFKNKNSWWIRDLGSTNGTIINGKKIIESPLKIGDVVHAGTAQIRVEASDDLIEAIELLSQYEHGQNTQKTDKVGTASAEIGAPIYSFPKLIFPEDFIPTNSKVMMDIYRKVHQICESDASVLLIGETGTGKEMMAKMLHLSSKRKNGPFVAINCAAIPDELAEAELFGIGEKVATAVSQRKGKIALADKGTLFLDELSSFPYELQAKVLRALQEKTVTPIGESKTIPVDFRLISATNQEPADLIRTQKLREDLYHRVATVEIELPPLRERREDLGILIPAMLHQIAQKENKRLSGISKKLMTLLVNYEYPGNIRELMNILRSMVALAHPGEILDVHLIPEKMLGAKTDRISMQSSEPSKPYDLRKTLQDVSRDLITQALAQNDGNIVKTAQHLQLTPFGLRKMMKRLNIKKV